VTGGSPDSDAVYSRLLRYVNVERGQKTVFKLDRMLELCSLLGNPQDAYRSIHVAGSKGKGSVSIMIARILEAGGRRVGLYTSPHILRWKERITLAGDEMPEEVLVSAAEEALSLLEGKSPADFPGDELPTYFELTTLIAFCAFRRIGCEDAVIETGLGGRLDSTNVVFPAASVITPIELEHTEWLGDTIPKIAAEKAGIIKAGRPCFISRQKPEAARIFVERSRELQSLLRETPRLVSVSELAIDPAGTRARIAFKGDSPLKNRFPSGVEVHTPMIGRIQSENMALALLAAGELDKGIGAVAAMQGLSKASLPARFEVVSLDPPIVLDGAHTPDSIRLSLESFNSLFCGPAILLFACAEDKKSDDMAAILAPRFDRIILTRPGSFKKGDLPAVERGFTAAGAAYRAIEDYQAAITLAIKESQELARPLLIAGSFYLCAETMKSAAFLRLNGGGMA
jgi:dihydrofolate synthase / folylpolyglutamate synthase